MDHDRALQILDETIAEAAGHGVILQTPDDGPLDGRTFRLDGRELLNFGSCSYLGLEMEPRLRQGVTEAVARYGTQFSSSRTYLSVPAYSTLESHLEELFGGPVVAMPSTTLGHLSALPVLVGQRDAVVLDQQVHHTVQLAANQVRLQGARVEVLRHGRLDLLEERIDALRHEHDRVWYLADGVYSMFADLAPAEELEALLERHPQLHLYVDDSHGMSWAGRHGRGQFLARLPIRDRVVVSASLNKAFAAAGSAFVFPDAESRRLVRACGGPMIFSGPIQPPMLGAAIASARIHLSPEIERLQAALAERVRLWNELAEARGLPVVSRSPAPIRTVGLGLPRAAYAMVRRLMADGFYVNVAAFPAVPLKQAGVRAALTLHHRPEDIEALVEALARHLRGALEEGGGSVADVERAFGLAPASAVSPAPPENGAPPAGRARPERGSGLRLERLDSIDALDGREWDRLLGARGNFTAEALRLFERTFRDGDRPEDRWSWRYYVVRDGDGEPVLATFFTHALWKDDMLAPPAVSRRVEARRRQDPYYLTSPVFAMGSLLTEGEHLFLDRSRDWRGALRLLLEAAAEDQAALGAETLVLRDFEDADAELGDALRDAGFVKVPLPPAHELDLDFATDAEYLSRLSPKARRHQLREVRPWEDRVEVTVARHPGARLTDAELAHVHRLYANVEERGFELNTFTLPPRLFREMLAFPSWELLLMRLPPEHGGPGDGRPVAMGAHFIGVEHYSPLIIGLDYDFVLSHRTYRQMLWQCVRRAREHGSRRLYWGMGASLEKRRFGARALRRCAYFQASDHYSVDVLAQLAADERAEPAGLRR